MIPRTRRFLKSALPRGLVLRLAALNHRFLVEPEVRWLSRYVDPTRASIDVGANQGVFAYALSRHCSKVYAYEPNPELFQFLEATAAKNVTVVSCGLSDRRATSTLLVPVIGGAVDAGRASVEPVAVSEFSEIQEITIELRRLDDEELPPVGFVKIDVEGHEMEVLRGARRLIAEHRPVLWIEVEQRHIEEPIADRLREICELGYWGEFFLDGGPAPLAEFDVARHQRPFRGTRRPRGYGNNFVFTPV